VRPIRMMSPRQVRGTVLAVLLCSALAGCGSVVASAPAAGQGSSAASSAGTTSSAASSAGPATSASASPVSPAGAAAVAVADAAGCTDVNQATSVAVHRVQHLVEPTRLGSLAKTQRDTALVRALYSQVCAAITHPDTFRGGMSCPADFGISYAGTFYAGSRALATFVYGASGCRTVRLTAGGKTRVTLMVGPAAAAAPKLQADLAAVLGVPSLVMAQPQSGAGMSQGGGPGK
jgi:uncharacterized protein YceK